MFTVGSRNNARLTALTSWHHQPLVQSPCKWKENSIPNTMLLKWLATHTHQLCHALLVIPAVGRGAVSWIHVELLRIRDDV